MSALECVSNPIYCWLRLINWAVFLRFEHTVLIGCTSGLGGLGCDNSLRNSCRCDFG